MSNTTTIQWAWGQNQSINFNPATDKLDFGWDFQSGQFTLSESNGSTVISIPSNEQTYTLKGVALSALHASNFSSNDASTMTYVMGVVSGNSAATTNPVTPVAPVDASSGSTSGGEVNNGGGSSGGGSATDTSGTAYASAWVSNQVYTAGERASFGDKVYQAKWWTQNETPLAVQLPQQFGNLSGI